MESEPPSRVRVLVKRAAGPALLAAAIGAVAVAWGLSTVDRWLFAVLDPGPFDVAVIPAAPDYEHPASWAALPATEDGADVFLPEFPAIDQTDASADVFYLHPTTWMAPAWNAPIDDPQVIHATTRGATLIQASAFNACCAIYAPRYRQAHGRAYVDPDPDGDRAINIAYADVSAAFDTFLAHTGERPFIVAAHSQGSVLAARLLRERIAGQQLNDRLVVAYLPGAPLRPETVGKLPICDTPTRTGCIAAWNARGPGYAPNGLEFSANDPDTMVGRICVNPITWSTDDRHVPASENAGAIFFDAQTPALKPSFADARCTDGSLVVTTMGDPERDFMSKVLLWMMGPENYHPIEYQLFYVDLRRNSVARVKAFAAAR